jgi:ferricrocin synthase
LVDLNLVLDEYDSTLLTLVSRPGDPVLSPDFQLVEGPAAKETTGIAGPEEDNEAGSELKWSKDATLLLGILSRFTKISGEKILNSSSLASMGLDSISALQISALAKRVDLNLSAPQIIKSTTVGELIKSLSHSTPVSFSSVKMEIESPLADVILTTLPRSLRDMVQSIYPVSPGMEWIIGAWQRSGGRHFQHVFIRKLRGRMNMSRMEEAWTALLRKHPILRATFVPVMRSQSIRLALCVLDQQPQSRSLACKKLPRGVKEEDAVRQEARISFNSPPPVPGIHSRLAVLEGKDTYLVINLHHFQYGEVACLLFKYGLYLLLDRCWKSSNIFSGPGGTLFWE